MKREGEKESVNPSLNKCVINVLAGDVEDRARAEKSDDVGTTARRCRLSTAAAAVGAANPSARACASSPDTSPPFANPSLSLALFSFIPSPANHDCFYNASKKVVSATKGRVPFPAVFFPQKRMRSWQYLSKAGNLNDNESAIRGSPLFYVRLGRSYVNDFFYNGRWEDSYGLLLKY